MELIQGWTKEEILSRIYNIILEPDLSKQERELLMNAKEVLNNGEDVMVVLEKLQVNFRRLDKKKQLSSYSQKFYESIPLELGKNRFSHENDAISQGKIACLFGAIIFTFITFNSIYRASSLISLVSQNPNGGSTVITISLMMIFLNLIQVIFIWIAFSKYDGKTGRGWSIFLLIYGILVTLYGVITVIANILEGTGYIISGASMIIAYALKKSELSRK